VKKVGDTIYVKLVFFGTALAGKTTILEWLFHNAVPPELKLGDQIKQVKTSFGQTLLFDFVPIQIADGVIARIFTATGQDYYAGTRPHILKGADGVFLVVDSQEKELEHNKEFVTELKSHFNSIEGLKDAELIVLLNKQDLEEIHPPEYLIDHLELGPWTAFSTSGVEGTNLSEALLAMLKRVAEKIEADGNGDR
jgi:signal recognition particle receptor subunit beta